MRKFYYISILIVIVLIPFAATQYMGTLGQVSAAVIELKVSDGVYDLVNNNTSYDIEGIVEFKNTGNDRIEVTKSRQGMAFSVDVALSDKLFFLAGYSTGENPTTELPANMRINYSAFAHLLVMGNLTEYPDTKVIVRASYDATFHYNTTLIIQNGLFSFEYPDLPESWYADSSTGYLNSNLWVWILPVLIITSIKERIVPRK